MPAWPTRRRLLSLASGLVLALGLAAPAAARAETVTVFAAASLKTALDEIAVAFTDLTGHEVTLALAGSSAMARQIQQGAPANVFISANADWMDVLQAEGLIAAGTRFNLVGNTLVLIAHGADAPEVDIAPEMDLPAMLGEGRLAMALVDAVPAGIYGKAALTYLGQWDAVAPRVAQADNVRAALALVASGEAPLGIVYASDALSETGVTVIGTFPAESHPAIIYPAAAIAGRDTPATAEFLAFLRGSAAAEAMSLQGFTLPGD